MRIKKMRTAEEIAIQSRLKSLQEQKREKLFRNLALIHSLAKVILIAYQDSLKGTNFTKPQIKAKSDQISKLSEDIIKSIGDAVRLKSEMEEYMEYEHFTEVYELLTILVFLDTDSIRSMTTVLTEERQKHINNIEKLA
ncbi:hypothetical protein HX021_08180 [Sphingobacterium sp. N143]|uniref:hypothetical protein n=1 Tax=Sphingobacterium sp. N143 TaxID=2746727 RepID=UPI0025791FE9|nr:hypothetical protein [Sphingobacterium sp. N143]MDM1294274.1 hypothetical protein [Sphingobacterium sp. N143]